MSLMHFQVHWGLGIRSTDTEVSRYRYKGGGLDIHSTDIEAASITVLLGINICTRSLYPYKGRGLGIGIARIKFVR